MPYFAVDDGFADHPKVVRLQGMRGWQSAIALWTLGGAWCSKHLTDGAVPAAVVSRLGFAGKDADLLVKAGLWERTEEGFQYHDWAPRNPLRTQVEARREKTARRVADWRGKQPSNDQGNGVTGEVSNDVSNPAPFPSLPIPSQLPPYPQRPAGPVKTHPSRLRAHLEDCVRAEFEKREEVSQKAAHSQWLSACERLEEAIDLGKFPGAIEACEALARAAVAEACRPGGRDLGFALQRVPFGRSLGLVRGLDAEEGV